MLNSKYQDVTINVTLKGFGGGYFPAQENTQKRMRTRAIKDSHTLYVSFGKGIGLDGSRREPRGAQFPRFLWWRRVYEKLEVEQEAGSAMVPHSKQDEKLDTFKRSRLNYCKIKE
jgi:hypothetical protein